MGTIAKLATCVTLTLGLAIPAAATASEDHAAPRSTNSHSAGVITLP